MSVAPAPLPPVPEASATDEAPALDAPVARPAPPAHPRRTRLWLAAERRFKQPMDELLDQLLLAERRTQDETAILLRVSQRTVSRWWDVIQGEREDGCT